MCDIVRNQGKEDKMRRRKIRCGEERLCALKEGIIVEYLGNYLPCVILHARACFTSKNFSAYVTKETYQVSEYGSGQSG